MLFIPQEPYVLTFSGCLPPYCFRKHSFPVAFLLQFLSDDSSLFLMLNLGVNAELMSLSLLMVTSTLLTVLRNQPWTSSRKVCLFHGHVTWSFLCFTSAIHYVLSHSFLLNRHFNELLSHYSLPLLPSCTITLNNFIIQAKTYSSLRLLIFFASLSLKTYMFSLLQE